MAGEDFHLDCFSGLAGDMFLGACLDLGMPLAVLEDAVSALALPGITVEARKARRGEFSGTRFRVVAGGRALEGPDPDEPDGGAGRAEDGARGAHGDPPAPDPGEVIEPAGHGRSPGQIRDLIEHSRLTSPVQERAIGLLLRLAEAEAKVHGIAVERVHFHEVGAVDSIVDLVGAAAAIEHLRPRRLTCGPVNLGGGAVAGAHGVMPVPPPAVAELVRGIPVFGTPHGELLTPTGAVLLAELVDEFCELPALELIGVGYGLGRREIPGRANTARLFCGRQSVQLGEVLVVECEIDDLPGEGFGFLLERLLAAGALDVYFTAVQMKKNRPGTLVTLLCRREQLEPLASLLLTETGSLGCRFAPAGRFEAERLVETVDTPYGRVRVKRARFGGREFGATPEFEDCRRAALERGITWREVWRAALVASEKGSS